MPYVEADDGQVGAVVVQVEETFLIVGVVHDLPIRNHLEEEALGPKGGFQFPQGGKVIVILLLAGKKNSFDPGPKKLRSDSPSSTWLPNPSFQAAWTGGIHH